MKTGGECRYFELIDYVCGDQRKTCFACVGKHSVFFLRRDLNGPVHEGADLNYNNIAKVIQDENSDQHCLFTLSGQLNGWSSDRLFVKAENRDQFLRHVRCNWQTDHMWRLGRVVVFPLSLHPITKERHFDNYLTPYIGHRWAKFQGYRFMLPEGFVDQPNSMQEEQTGEYVNAQGVTLVVHVHEAFSLEQLGHIARDNIRWVAGDYKAQLCSEESHFYVLKNAGRAKRMNLAADIAAWFSWEIIIRTKSATLLCILLRRQYVPPICHSAQDIALLLRCPEEEWRKSELQLMLGAYQMADTLCTDAPNVAIYRDMVQAKLDSLRFDEDGMEWIGSHLKLKTRWQTEAKRWVRTLWNLLCQEAVPGFDSSLLTASPAEVLVDGEPDEEWTELEDIEDFTEFIADMYTRGEGLPLDGKQGKALDDDTRLRIQNQWLARVGRYFAWAVDGGLLGARFNLDLLIEGMEHLAEEAAKKAQSSFLFMLHLRPRDMTKPYLEVSPVQQLKEKNISQWMFNDRVMLAILSTDLLKKQIGKGRDADFFLCLSNLLEASCGVNLKAYICRLFMELQLGAGDAGAAAISEDTNLMVVPALLSLLNSGGLFLATYASAALVNMSNGNQSVKRVLMGHNMATLAVRNINSKDDDLGYYTLMLMVNLTKEPHNRSIIASAGLMPCLYDILTSSYHQVRPAKGKDDEGGLSNAALGSLAKERLLTQVAIVIGQFCNDDGFREQFIDMYPHTVKCMLYIFTTTTLGSTLSNKVMFALKQLCASRNDQKHVIGSYAIPHLLEGLSSPDTEKNSDFIYQSLVFLTMMSGLTTNVELMFKFDLINVLQELKTLPVARKVHEFQAKVARLMASMSELAASDE